jgi:hypothetical protein
MTTQAMKSTAVHVSWANRLTPGLLFLISLILITVYSVSTQIPWQVTPASAPAQSFSAERAMLYMPDIASEPHPAGSKAQARLGEYLIGKIEALGLQANIQPFGAYKNIAARLPGADSTGAIVVLAHYDSVPGGPGAADNGSGVAALLEMTLKKFIRRLAARGRLFSHTRG